MRLTTPALGIGILGGLLCSGAAAMQAAPPAGGMIHIFVTYIPASSANGMTVITGAIGDVGKMFRVALEGTPDPTGDYEKFALKKGTITFDAAALFVVFTQTQITDYPATCSQDRSVSASVTLSGGTGRYAGITGTLNLIDVLGYVYPTYTSGAKKGQCNEGANPIGDYETITGVGTVHSG